jgi:hypothetical protein
VTRETVDGGRPAMTAGGDFYSRRDVLVASGSSSMSRPEVDALRHFARSVLPHLVRCAPAVRVLVRGAVDTDVVAELGGPHVAFGGAPADRDEMFESARCALVLVPDSGTATASAVEALLHGVPVVTTSAVVADLDSAGGSPVMIRDDPIDMAAATASLLTNPTRWRAMRREALGFRAARTVDPLSASPDGGAHAPLPHDREYLSLLVDTRDQLRERMAELFTAGVQHDELQAAIDDREVEIARLRSLLMTQRGEMLAQLRGREALVGEVERLECAQRLPGDRMAAPRIDADGVDQRRAVLHRAPPYMSLVRSGVRWLAQRARQGMAR